MVDTFERLAVLLAQEDTVYRTSDYLTRMQQAARDREIAVAESLAAAEAEQQRLRCGSSCSYSSSSSSVYSDPKKRKLQWEKHHRESSPEAEELSQPYAKQCGLLASQLRESVVSGGRYGSSPAGATEINQQWREKICEWEFQVVDHFGLNREVVSVAMSHLDRYLEAYEGTLDINVFRLLAMTCLYLSIKLNESKSILIPGSESSMDTILRLRGGSSFTRKEMESMECDILHRLRWHVHPPTAQLFANYFLSFMSAGRRELRDLHELSRYMMELSVMDYFFVSHKPSDIAIAALRNAAERLGHDSAALLSFPFAVQFLDIDSPSVRACRAHLYGIYATAKEQIEMEEREAPIHQMHEVHEVAQSPVSVTVVSTTRTTNGHHRLSSSPRQSPCRHHQPLFEYSPTSDDMDTSDHYYTGVAVEYDGFR